MATKDIFLLPHKKDSFPDHTLELEGKVTKCPNKKVPFIVFEWVDYSRGLPAGYTRDDLKTVLEDLVEKYDSHLT